jgi:outer membrane lipoprotein-sorting protein
MRPLAMLALLSTLALVAVAHGDAPSDTLLKRARETMSRLETLQADVELLQPSGRSYGKLTLKRPNLVRLEVAGTDAVTLVSDGQAMYRYFPARKEFLRLKPGSAGESILLPGVYDIGFFKPVGTSRIAPQDSVTLSEAEAEKVGDTDCEVLQTVAKSSGGAVETTRYAIGAKDGLVYRIQRKTVTKRSVNAAVPLTLFQWTPPADAKPFRTEIPKP